MTRRDLRDEDYAGWGWDEGPWDRLTFAQFAFRMLCVCIVGAAIMYVLGGPR